MEPDSLCLLTLITKLRVIRRSVFGVPQNTPAISIQRPLSSIPKVRPRCLRYGAVTVVKNAPLEMRRAVCPRTCDFCPKSKIKGKIPAWITDVFIAQSENKYPVICNRNPVSPFPTS